MLSILMLLLFSNIDASYWTTAKPTSYEVQALVESFKMEFMTEEEKIELQAKLAELDSLLSRLDQKDHFFASKTSIYKWLLKNKPNINIPRDFVLDNFKSRADSNELGPFPRWLLTVLRSDSAKLIKDSSYSTYRQLLAKDETKAKRLKIHKRISMIKPWLYLFQKESADQIDLRMMKFHHALLNHVIGQLKVYYRFRNQTFPQPSSNLSYFRLSTQEKKAAPSEEKALSLIDEVISKNKKDELPVPTNDWSLSDQDSWSPRKTNEFSQLQKVNLDNPEPKVDYQAPDELPTPLDDWIWD